jgi:dolichol-phosphate mannosyltransferase
LLKINSTLSADPTPVEISFVIPCHNEQDNLRALVTAIREATDPLKRTYEIVIADDFSSDDSWTVLKELAAGDARVRGLRFAFNCGQSAALWAGMKESRGRYIVTLDAAE